MSNVVLIDEPVNQRQRLTMEGVKYDIDLLFNPRAGIWVVSIYNTQGIALVEGVALVLGVNPFDQYNLGIGALVVYDTENESNEANELNFGSTVLLVQMTEDEARS